MIIKVNERNAEHLQNMRGGDGIVNKLNYLTPAAVPNVKMLSEIRLDPGCSIGIHAYMGESEIFICKEGDLLLTSNGKPFLLSAGDAAVCLPGETHGLANRGQAPAAVYAVIVTE